MGAGIKTGEFLKQQKHLPKFMRDFHAQKDVFKTVHWLAHKNKKEEPPVNWIDGHVYTIDYFLRFMAHHGYTLQKSRVDCEFYDIENTIALRKKQEEELFSAMLERSRQNDAENGKGEGI